MLICNLAVTENLEELQQILTEDCYCPNLANYEIREFEPNMIATDMAEFEGK
ncbi:hypothetical protein [[Mannheimia] succiniciproducens]|uniref:Uncharacterized protein n=1 Tax=Mannheimia succiniciproducens (strain KCTC 0769BP / MBEL55E) TaxID=221988 RepID=Q65SM1_MANSM|nr:hypothetical protein [[Mannheimia] succiniciproducens]AAU38039.1 unknown [[Mannheimia] succiniciproducens MBEL55E]